MHEIKFRGRDTDRNWHYGDLLRYVRDSDDMIIPVGHANSDDLYDDVVCVDYDTVGQFTGLKDANGREIYEGDIVKCGSGRICKVVFFTSACACCFDLVPVGGFDCKPPKESTLWTDLTVIGNVYDNPDLLEAYV